MTEEQTRWLKPRVEAFKALGHPSRLYIARLLRERPYSVGELTDLVGADPSTVSKHLSVLRNAGIVSSRREGAVVYYSLVCECLGAMFDSVDVIVRTRSGELSEAVAGTFDDNP